MATATRLASAGSESAPRESNEPLRNGADRDASSSTRADSMVSVSASDACARSPPARAAFKRSTGLSMNSPLETVQSRAFLNEPGTPWAYSGLEMTKPSAARSWSRKVPTARPWGDRAFFVQIGVERRQRADAVADGYDHGRRGEADRCAQQRRVRGLRTKAPGKGEDVHRTHCPRPSCSGATMGRRPVNP